MASVRPPSTSPVPRRSPAVLAALGVFVAYQAAVFASNFYDFHKPSEGFAYHVHDGQRVHARRLTPEAYEATHQLGETMMVRSINGVAAGSEGFDLTEGSALVHREPGESNRFVLADASRDDAPIEVTLPVSQPRLWVLWTTAPDVPLFDLVGLFYFALGVWVWWRRPADRAAAPLLIFTLVLGLHASFCLGMSALSRGLALVPEVAPVWYAPAIVNLGLRFTGFHQSPRLRLLLWYGLAVSLVLFVLSIVSLSTGALPSQAMPMRVAVGLHAAVGVLITMGLSFAAARSPHPIGLQRRARVLGIAVGVGLLFPALTLLMPPMPGIWIITMLLLTTFPLIMAYGVVRLGMFDIRVVLGRGLVYVVLSVAVLLAYMGLVFAAIGLVGEGDNPLFGATLLAVTVVFLSLGQLRVQGAVNRLVFRGRYVYADALAAASDQLARTRTRGEMLDIVRTALMDAMKVSRAYMALPCGEDALECTTLGFRPDERTGEMPDALPRVLRPSRYAPIARALSTRQAATAYDSHAASLQLAAGTLALAGSETGSCEATFWSRYGVDWIVPVKFGAASDRRVVGLLLIGPRRDGGSFDREDERLIVTLANQLAVAIENSSAFEEVRRLKEGLEEQVDARTRELSDALAELKRAQAQLVESEKQATLGRLVAGIVHEVNTPLGSLRSSADTNQRMIERCLGYLQGRADSGDPEAKKLLGMMEGAIRLSGVMLDSAARMGALMDSLRRFVALDESELKPFDVREGIDSALTLLSPKLGHGITVTRAFTDADATVNCYPARLNQVFLNLIDNAATAVGGQGSIEVAVTRDRGVVGIEVRDDGDGIDPSRLPSLFEFGFTQKQGRVSMRMGLASNKQTVEELGGSISIRSDPGHGTAVRVELPAHSAAMLH